MFDAYLFVVVDENVFLMHVEYNDEDKEVL